MGGFIKYNFNWNDNSIVNDPAFPKHIWTFLAMNKPYDEKMWKSSGLADFGLAHIFGYQAEEKYLEQKVFQTDDAGKQPESYFTSASNTVLIPNDFLPLMDTFETVKIAFYKRHIDLYGKHSAIASGLDERYIPDWYEDIKWNPPLLPDNWQHKTDNLLAYRRRILI